MTEVRDAVVTDADAIGRIHVRCWRHAYVGLMPHELLESLDEDARVEKWRHTLATAVARRAVLVSVDAHSAVTGFAVIGPTQDGTGLAHVGELAAIYLAPAAIGTGVGRVLLASAMDRLRAEGFTQARLDVIPGNTRARAVYERAGWRADGAPWDVDHGGHVLPHQRYVVEL